MLIDILGKKEQIMFRTNEDPRVLRLVIEGLVEGRHLKFTFSLRNVKQVAEQYIL